MNDKLTHKSQDALSTAIQRAAADGSPQVDPLHLLLTLLEQEGGTTAPLLRAVGADPALVAKQAEERLGRLPRARGATLSAPEMSRPPLSAGPPPPPPAQQPNDEDTPHHPPRGPPAPARGQGQGPPGPAGGPA